MRLSIRAQQDNKNYDLDNWQVVVKQAVNVEDKAVKQVFSLARKSNACCCCSYRLLQNEEFRNQKNSKAIKNYPSTNNNNGSGNRDQSGQATSRSSKKDSRWSKGD